LHRNSVAPVIKLENLRSTPFICKGGFISPVGNGKLATGNFAVKFLYLGDPAGAAFCEVGILIGDFVVINILRFR